MMVLNRATGLSEALAEARSQGVTVLQLARNLVAGSTTGRTGNGGPSNGAPGGGG